MKTIRKATIRIIVIASVVAGVAAAFAAGASVWANKPRGVRIKLDID